MRRRKPIHVNLPGAVGKLLELNARIRNLANNRIAGCKENGLRDTLDTAAKNGILTFDVSFREAETTRTLELPGSGGIGIFGVIYGSHPQNDGGERSGSLAADSHNFDNL